MSDLDKLGELLYYCKKDHDKVLDWYKEHKDDPIFKTEEGIKLRNYLGEMMESHAHAVLAVSLIECTEGLCILEHTEHAKHDLSKETINAFRKMNDWMKEALK